MQKLALPSNGVVRMADSQYIFVSSCQHDFNAVVYATYLAYSRVPLCEADPGQVSCCAFVTSLPPPCGWLPGHKLWRWGMVATALNITCGGEGPGRECHQLWRVANPSCSLTDPGLKRLIITRCLILYLAGEQYCECISVVQQHFPHAPRAVTSSWSSLTPPQQHFRRAH